MALDVAGKYHLPARNCSAVFQNNIEREREKERERKRERESERFEPETVTLITLAASQLASKQAIKQSMNYLRSPVLILVRKILIILVI